MNRREIEYVLNDLLELKFSTNRTRNAELIGELLGKDVASPSVGFLRGAFELKGSLVVIRDSDGQQVNRLVLLGRSSQSAHFYEVESLGGGVVGRGRSLAQL